MFLGYFIATEHTYTFLFSGYSMGFNTKSMAVYINSHGTFM